MSPPERPAGSELAGHWSLDPEIVLLNHGSFGACPTAVLEAKFAWERRAERDTMRFHLYDLEGLLDEARAELGAFVGSDPEDIAFMTNATEGVNTVLRSLDLRAGDEVLTTNEAYPGCVNALEYVCKRADAKIVRVELPWPVADEQEIVDRIVAGVSDRTRLAMIDHISSATGIVLPITQIVRELDSRGVDTLVDAAHAPGQVPVDLRALRPAYYTANCHKWVCSPKGSAFLHVRRDRQDAIRPVVISHGATSPRTDRTRFLLEADWVGTRDFGSWLSIADAIRCVGGMVDGGWDTVRRTNHALALRGREIIAGALGTEHPSPGEMIGSLASIMLPVEELPAGGHVYGSFVNEVGTLQLRLLERWGIHVPVITMGPGRSHVRISAQLYNSEDQMAYLARALVEELRL